MQPAIVVARWDGHRVLLETTAGTSIPLELRDDPDDRLDIGDELLVELGPDGQVVSWSSLKDP